MHLQIIVYLHVMLSHSLNLSFTYSTTGITGDDGLKTGGLLESRCNDIPRKDPRETQQGGWVRFSNIDILGKVWEELKSC